MRFICHKVGSVFEQELRCSVGPLSSCVLSFPCTPETDLSLGSPCSPCLSSAELSLVSPNSLLCTHFSERRKKQRKEKREREGRRDKKGRKKRTGKESEGKEKKTLAIALNRHQGFIKPCLLKIFNLN